jgi:hypothetical protein
MVLLGILVLSAVGAFILFGVNRNGDVRFAFQRTVAGFNAAEAGINIGAAGVLNAMQNFGLPTNCSTGGTTVAINGRNVTYRLSVPGGTPGSCAETPQTITETAASPFGGLNALLYTYNLSSSATNALGFTESSVGNQFQAHLIPVFQFAAFYAKDLEYLPGPPLVVNGRLHTNGDLYLNSDDCGSSITDGMNILGPITIVGSGVSGTAPLNRGRKDDLTVNWNNVYLSLDGTSSNMQVLGTDSAGSTSCSQVATRQIPQSEINTFNTGGNIRIATGLKNLSLPLPSSLLCVPWITGCSGQGTYWQNAAIRIVLDTTTKQPLGAVGTGPALYPVKVLNVDGSLDTVRTASLQLLMQTTPGAITYSDVPVTSNTKWDCRSNTTCETDVYANGSAGYGQAFPTSGAYVGCTAARGPRTQIYTITGVGSNYCNDYRYGGFYNWRESKPILLLNIDWMALEEWNNNHANALFNPAATTNGGLVAFFSVKDTTGTEGYKADSYGVRIYDAGRVQRGSTDPGVTLATDQAMYITGNFNCPQPNPGADTSPAGCGDATWPPATGAATLEKPTSVIADTVNVLSCGWIASSGGVTNPPCGTFNMNADQWAANGGCGVTSAGSGCRPRDEASTSGGTFANGEPATQTIINTAFLAGNDQTWCSSTPSGRNCGQSYYSGGLENYPRFHENWTNVKFWYQGSFVAVGTPYHDCFDYTAQLISGVTIADDPTYSCTKYTLQGFWSTQRYVPPLRRWFYDVSFNNAATLPPLSPRFAYLSLIYFTQVFQ